MYCAMHYSQPLAGDLLPLVWNDQAPLMVAQSQRISDVSRKFGAGGGIVYSVVGCVASCTIGLFVLQLIWPIPFGVGSLQLWLTQAIVACHCGEELGFLLEYLRTVHWRSSASHFFQCCIVLRCWHWSLSLWFDSAVLNVIHHCNSPVVVLHSSMPILEFLLPTFQLSIRAVCFHSSFVVVFASWLQGTHG